MDNPYNKVNSFSVPNWDSIMTDRYFQMAAAYPNVNFRATQTSQVTSPYALSEVQSGIANKGEIPVIASDAAQSSGGMTFGEAALGAAVIGGGALYLIKTGKFSKLLNAGKSVLGIGKKADGKVSKLTAIITKDGIRFLQPGKYETITGNDKVIKFMKDNGIEFTKAEQEFRAGISILTGFNAEGYNIVLENGQIKQCLKEINGETIDVLNKLENPANDTIAEQYKTIQNILAELGKTTDANKTILKKATNIRFNNTVGDNTLHLSMANYGEKAELNELTALKRYKFTDKEIKELKLSETEKAFANESFWKDKKIGEEFTIGEYSHTIGGQRCNFEGNRLVSVVENGTSYEEDSAHYINFLNKYRNRINSIIKNIYEKHQNIELGTIINV